MNTVSSEVSYSVTNHSLSNVSSELLMQKVAMYEKCIMVRVNNSMDTNRQNSIVYQRGKPYFTPSPFIFVILSFYF
jgi:hypothetical protein